jgi:hypothetical protein
VFFGPSESLKTWAALKACCEMVEARLTALVIDFESNDVSFVERVQHIGLAEGYLGRALQYMRPEDPLVFTDRKDGTVKEFDEPAIKSARSAARALVDAYRHLSPVHSQFAGLSYAEFC